ncbi:aminoacyl-tRNA synthetase [Polaromonas sp.]|jgi:hypothetical protein|uniref:aminoacyl-tRNA synthetase n=1 Tax=Polaromonas sp. TaxID=1869339 RepID=UPI0025CF0414|nr:aminoacyl-tRNA synthetase [Polaromonas sp.]
MRMSDQEYFRSCIAKERQLAHLLGHPQVEECYESAGTLWDKAQALPQWTRDWRACGPLMTEYGLTVTYGQDAGGPFARIGDTLVHFSDHPTRDRAVMFGIVKALIFQLEHGAPAGAKDASVRPMAQAPAAARWTAAPGGQS